MQTPTSTIPDSIPDEAIATLVEPHLVTDSSSHDNDSVRHGQDPDQDTQTDREELIPIPYHLPGTAITHDIYSHANTLRAGQLQRSKSSNDVLVKAGKMIHKDSDESDPVLENLNKPGGFRRYHFITQQQQQQQQNNASPEQELARSYSPHPPNSISLFRPQTASSCDSYTMLESVARSSTIGSMRGVQTRHFLEYLAVTSVMDRFAGENLSDSDDDDEESAPLLQTYRSRRRGSPRRVTEEGAPKHKASMVKTGFLLFKAFISSGILFLPKAFSNGGLFFSICILYLMGFISLFCFLRLLECKNYVAGSYGDIGGAMYGPWMRRIVLFSIAISQLGFMCGGTIFIVENIIQAVRSLSHHAIQLTSTQTLTMVALLLMPFVLIRNIAKLSSTALFADVLIVMGLLILLACDVHQIFFSSDTPQPGPNVEWLFNPSAYPVFIGTAVYSFEGIGLIIPIRDAMERPEKFPLVLTIVMGIVATVLCLVGSLGYVAFGTDVKTVALLNLPDGLLGNTVQLFYALAVHLTNALTLFPTVRIVEHALFGERTGKHNATIKWQKNALRCAIVIVGAVIAWAGANDLDKFISLIGSICCCPLSLIFPPLFHMGLEGTKGWQRLVDQVLITFGTGIMLFTLWNTANKWGSQ
ncbi:hypothetical protein K492DRAFT_139636 [Lichtheimia hyalospora FSU 10163]|nr:hypothetical protein K492DRAFT_139636 [Lichtheimia hyalospora FSU 10163]